MPKHAYITDRRRLAEACESLADEAVIAVDTEFFWERTYYPILGLVQLATESGGCFLIDCVAIHDLSVIAPLLESGNIIKILHDAPQDLGILARATGAGPRNIFDTRTSAGFCGFESICSLQNLLKQALDIDIPKSETRSNWIRRPLSESQLEYAADDVLHLPALREHLIQRCKDSAAAKWMDEENALLEQPDCYSERNPRDMFRRVKGHSRLNARQLAAWREIKARQRDLPRNRILRDATLVEMARKMPASSREAKAVSDFPAKMPPGVVNELLAAITRAQKCPETDCPRPEEIDTATRITLRERAKLLLEHVRDECEKHGIDPALVASRADAETLILNLDKGESPAPKFSQSWRREIVRDWPHAPGN